MPINVKKRLHTSVIDLNMHRKQQRIRTVNLVAKHVNIATVCSTTNFTVWIYAVVDM